MMTSDGLVSIGSAMSALPMFDSIRKAAGPVICNDGDQQDAEGRVICGRCGAFRSMKVGGLMMPCNCLCDKAEMEHEAIRRHLLESQKARIEKLRKDGISQDFEGARFELDDHADERTGNVARRYAANFGQMMENNTGLMLYGNPGGGKTFMAGCIANAVVDQGHTVIMTGISALVTAMSAEFEARKMDILRSIAACDLLILDDVGVEADTAYRMEKKFEIFDTRSQAGKPMIVTTNTMTPDRLRKPQNVEESRLFSRMRGSMLYIKVDHEDRRDEQHRDKVDAMRELLGL